MVITPVSFYFQILSIIASHLNTLIIISTETENDARHWNDHTIQIRVNDNTKAGTPLHVDIAME